MQGSFRWYLILIFFLILSACKPLNSPYFQIQVVDAETGRGIPMVEMTPLNNVSYFTDSQGYIAFEEDGLMGERVYFEISSPGYQYPADTSGRNALSLEVVQGGKATVQMQRLNIAERLYRVTGSGIYRDSELLGIPTPISGTALRAGVLGQDSNLEALYKGKLFWIWGDSFLPEDYHGNFAVAAATVQLPGDGGLSPDMGVQLKYITDQAGRSKSMLPPKGPGYVWFDWLMTIQDSVSGEQLIAKYARVDGFFGNYERGIARFNDSLEIFERIRQIDEWLPDLHTCHHPFAGKSPAGRHYYLTSEFSLSRILPNLRAITDPTAYESYTCLKPGTRFEDPEIERNATGEVVYAWKRDTDPISHARQQELIQSGLLKESESWVRILDIETGETIETSRSSLHWNEFRQRWVLIMGSKDIWFAEADTPTGPWGYARKVATHDILLYNPLHHPHLDQEGGRYIYFEGTYTQFFGQGKEVPRYNYNQLMYKLDLASPEVQLPVPIYQLAGVEGGFARREQIVKSDIEDQIENIPFFAMGTQLDEPDIIPIYQVVESGQVRLARAGEGEPLFYAIDPAAKVPEAWAATWESRFNFRSINNSVSLKIHKEGGEWKVQSNKSSFAFSEAQIRADSLLAQLEHEGDSYILKARIEQQKLTGSWKRIGVDKSGSWAGKSYRSVWTPRSGASLIEVYEYRDAQTGRYSYSTQIPQNQQGRLLCRVWQNPTSVRSFDFGIESD